MADYRKMYSILCAGVSALLDDMPPVGDFEPFYHRLEALLHEAEEIYIETADVIHLPDRSDK